ncbi:hypothetical protein U0070_027571, partial [Myodes glareolus]
MTVWYIDERRNQIATIICIVAQARNLPVIKNFFFRQKTPIEDGITHSMSIDEVYTLTQTIVPVYLAGQNLTDFLTKIITIVNKQPQVLFFLGTEYFNIQETTLSSIMMCDINIHKELYANTVLICDHRTTNRMQEINALILSMMKIEIIVLHGCKYSVWIISCIPEGIHNALALSKGDSHYQKKYNPVYPESMLKRYSEKELQTLTQKSKLCPPD